MVRDTRSDLGGYLRHRRAEMTPPSRPGVAPTSHRRVPGLRRQELADLAGLSVDYYIRLEQGRATRPSRDVLAALARAFGLSKAERDHLFRLAGESAPLPTAPDHRIRPGILRLLHSLEGVMPATVHDGRLDVLALNADAAGLLGPLRGEGPYGRNIVYQCFTASGLRDLLDDDGVEQFTRVAVSELRTALGRYPEDEYLRSLFDELVAVSAAFRARWEQGEIGAWRSAFKRLRHPSLGWVSVDTEMLHDPEPDHWIMLYAPRVPS
ncbi:transcriptional regulator with XRE-family HTH domain [Actinoalloteichus hoggarensis]|uniref:Helix-turn-helix protein n=1 Tax=Actinoalloteichus hoggarensis TaxID=1470176 RepID=A0A221W5A6_9PSEU|nr:helix-turn-helix transcriptional regulator [Actinoalloteichus hoggarensis]ASO21100.1 helix-turn-helix protein [Actinoalloteichus hoggarensis]MBB5921030.1 transcriptional regulator with XRE-family HTH domain [Actinoalloteichus hoggarensis]